MLIQTPFNLWQAHPKSGPRRSLQAGTASLEVRSLLRGYTRHRPSTSALCGLGAGHRGGCHSLRSCCPFCLDQPADPGSQATWQSNKLHAPSLPPGAASPIVSENATKPSCYFKDDLFLLESLLACCKIGTFPELLRN